MDNHVSDTCRPISFTAKYVTHMALVIIIDEGVFDVYCKIWVDRYVRHLRDVNNNKN